LKKTPAENACAFGQTGVYTHLSINFSFFIKNSVFSSKFDTKPVSAIKIYKFRKKLIFFIKMTTIFFPKMKQNPNQFSVMVCIDIKLTKITQNIEKSKPVSLEKLLGVILFFSSPWSKHKIYNSPWQNKIEIPLEQIKNYIPLE
jgi:hypothetical protein